MELWNTRHLKAPPTYTYKANVGEVDTGHLRTILEDGVKFYREQYLIKLETALLARIVYRMKTKFRNSKDFKTLEKVKRDLMVFSNTNIIKKIQHFLSVLPTHSERGMVFLPTKNMMQFILVNLQGIGKLLCRTIDTCQKAAELYEYRLHLGHFWRLALLAVALVSRIQILLLNIVKFTCLLYIRLLPFGNKLKNSGIDWLPNDYIFPKDLKEWLNIEWTTLEEVFEVPDEDFNISMIDLGDDSDDVEFCNEYIEVDEEDEDLEIISEFKKIHAKKITSIDFDKSVTILRGFATRDADIGEVIPLEENVF